MVETKLLRRALMDEDNITLNEIKEIFNLTDEELLESIKRLINESENDSKLRARLEERNDIIYGTIHINRDNKGIVNFGNNKYHIETEDLYDALDEDKVILEVLDEEKSKAKVKAITKRKDGLLIANYVNGKIIPVYSPINTEIVINEEDLKYLRNDDRVQLYLERTEGNTTYARVEQVIGHKDDIALEENSVIVQSGFHRYFPTGVSKELEDIPEDDVSSKDIRGRVDLRSKNAFTIDDDDTQDMDDALYVESLPNGHTIVGIPVSHVSFYVPLFGAIFNEACYRGTSVYLGKHSEPMFPRKLCNGIGSLNEGKDRLTRTVIVEFDENNNIVHYAIVPSVIRSRKKMSYEKVEQIIVKDTVPEGYDPYVNDLKKLYEISNALEKRKQERGAITFFSQDIKVVFDNLMKPLGFRNLGNPEARKIIENFALLANELYDMDAKKRGIKNINRVETPPSQDKVNDLIKKINFATGYNIPEIKNINNQMEMIGVIEALKQDPRFPVFSSIILRGMQKAFYSTEELGHYGLALVEFYAQFTSPIRRLGDFINHCQYDALDKGLPNPFTQAQLEEYAKQASYMELQSDLATNEINKYYAAELMKEHLGETFEGRIIDLSPSGALVKTDTLTVGKVSPKDMLYGKYKYDKETGAVYDKEKNLAYHIGDRVELIAKDANPNKRTVDFTLVDKLDEKKKVLKKKCN